MNIKDKDKPERIYTLHNYILGILQGVFLGLLIGYLIWGA